MKTPEKTEKTEDVLERIGITPEQVVASLQGTTLLIMNEKGLCQLVSGNSIPNVIYEQFIVLDAPQKIKQHSIMDVRGWGKMDGIAIQMYNFQGLPWAFAVQEGTMSDRYLKELFKDCPYGEDQH